MNKERFIEQMREAAEVPEAEKPITPEPESSPVEETPQPGTAAPDPEAVEGIPDPEVETPPEPKGTKEILADKGLDIADLYEMQVPGTDLTFGQMKDAAPDVADVSRLKLDVEKQRDELTKQHTEERTQMEAVLGRLVNEFGQEKIGQLVQQAPADVSAVAEANKAELLRWRPELTDDAAYSQAISEAAAAARVYGIPAQAVQGAGAGLQRAFMRLAKLEGYLESLRRPAKPKKEVRATAKTKGNDPSVKIQTKFKTRNKQRDKFLQNFG